MKAAPSEVFKKVLANLDEMPIVTEGLDAASTIASPKFELRRLACKSATEFFLLKTKPEREASWVNGHTLREFASVQCILLGNLLRGLQWAVLGDYATTPFYFCPIERSIVVRAKDWQRSLQCIQSGPALANGGRIDRNGTAL
jgi:hypothetical protein